MTDESSVPPEVTDLDVGCVLYDRRRKGFFHVTAVDDTSVGLHRAGTDLYVPHSLYVAWQDTRLVTRDELTDPDLPEWMPER